MKKVILGVISTAVILTGCESKTGTGALVGAGGGAVIGGAVGGWQGALSAALQEP